MSSPSSTSSSTSAIPSYGKKRVSAEHTLNRVRENQRRHRARRKDYISTLEQKLAATELQLEEAKKEIERLRAGRDDDQWSFNVDVMSQPDFPDPNTPISGVAGEEEASGCGGEMGMEMEMRRDAGYEYTQRQPLQQYSPPPTQPPSAISSTPSPASLDPPIPTGPPPCCTDAPPTPTSHSPTPPDPECASCKTRPAPSPTESTTLCSQAYILIAQQNFRGIDPATIRRWLGSGFRSARREGEGCRVENSALMGVLDFISGCEERVGVPCGHEDSNEGAVGEWMV